MRMKVRSSSSRRKWILRLAVAAPVVLIAGTIVWCWRVYTEVEYFAAQDQAVPADAFAVFGAAEYDGRPSPVYRARLDHAASLYKRRIAPVIVTLGGDGGDILPSDGAAVGEIEVRGPWITGSYYQDDDAAKFHDGWLRTGDVGTLDERGFIRLTDRAKDVIKSGGEWISSMELENVLMAHPDVAEAAVIGIADQKWGERPLAAVVLRSGADVSAEKLRAFMAEQIPRWQLPERWCFIAEVPKTSVGKFSKRQMREAYQRGDYEIIEVR